MSDTQPEPERTFWFKCPRGHVEERPMPGDGDPPLRCFALVVKSHEGASGIYTDACGEDLHHVGPTVGEWRACNEALRAEQVEHTRGHEHLERLLVEADAALAECSRQLDEAMTREALQDTPAGPPPVEPPEDWEQRRAAGRWPCTDEDDEPDRIDLAAELARRLTQTEQARDTYRVQRDEWRVMAGTEQAGRLEAERHVEHHHRRGGSFTLVRDVNAQTEAALRRAEAALRDSQHEQRGARQEVTHWREVALWAAERDRIDDLPQAVFQQRSEVLSDRYEAEMEGDSH